VNNLNLATLRLFNGIQINLASKVNINAKTYTRMIQNGYVLDPRIAATPSTLTDVEAVIGLSGTKANAALHKSWDKVANAPIGQLIREQIVHYLTTYGFEWLGCYDSDLIYVPAERLEIPNLDLDKIPLTVVHAYTAEELSDLIVKLGGGIALSEQTLVDIMTVVEANNFSIKIADAVHNRELQCRLFDYFGTVPQDAESFLRYVIYRLTGETLVIKNAYLINRIKTVGKENSKLLDSLMDKASPVGLARIFLRYKPLFLALRSISHNKALFNRIRKMANDYHRPLPKDYLNSVTEQIKHDKLDLATLQAKLDKATIFRKIRLAHALQFRLNNPSSIVYRIRNGKTYTTDFTCVRGTLRQTQAALSATLDSISSSLAKIVKGKTVYIPENIEYTLPATEKQFTGNIPTGSYIDIGDNLVAGVHWFDLHCPRQRIDLDLSIINADGKIGWDGQWRTGDRGILFSGDMTAAPKPKGASELFLVRDKLRSVNLLCLNHFNRYGLTPPIPYTIFAGTMQGKLKHRCAIDPNDMLITAHVQLETRTNIVGLITNGRFYFANMGGQAVRSIHGGKYAHQVRSYLANKVQNGIYLRDMLIDAGAKVVTEQPTDENDEYINLAPENLTKTSFLDLLPAVL